MLALWGSQLFLRPVKGDSEIPVLAGIPAWDPSWDPRPSERHVGDSGSRGIPAWDPSWDPRPSERYLGDSGARGIPAWDLSWDPGHRWDPSFAQKACNNACNK